MGRDDGAGDTPDVIGEGTYHKVESTDRHDTETFDHDATSPASVGGGDLPTPSLSAELREVSEDDRATPKMVRRTHAAEDEMQGTVVSRGLMVAAAAVVAFGLLAGLAVTLTGGGGTSAGEPVATPTELGGDPAEEAAVEAERREHEGVKVQSGMRRKPLPPKRNIALPIQNLDDEGRRADEDLPAPAGVPMPGEEPAEGAGDDPPGPAAAPAPQGPPPAPEPTPPEAAALPPAAPPAPEAPPKEEAAAGPAAVYGD